MQTSRTHYGPFKMVSWFRCTRRGAVRTSVLSTLSSQQIANNTTRGSTPGLIDPARGDIPGNRVPLPTMGSRMGTRLCGGRKRNAAQANVDQGNDNATGSRKRPAQGRRKAPSQVSLKSALFLLFCSSSNRPMPLMFSNIQGFLIPKQPQVYYALTPLRTTSRMILPLLKGALLGTTLTTKRRRWKTYCLDILHLPAPHIDRSVPGAVPPAQDDCTCKYRRYSKPVQRNTTVSQAILGASTIIPLPTTLRTSHTICS